jgi:hypothetical protein
VQLTADEVAAARAFVAENGLAAACQASQIGVPTLRKVLAGAEPVARLTAELVRSRLVRDARRI